MHRHRNLVAQLRHTIGAEVEYNGLRCTVVELLEEPLGLVLQATSAHTTIQDNQFGRPQRRVSQSFTLPCLNDGRTDELSEALLALGLNLQ